MAKVGCLHMRIWDDQGNMGFPVFVMYPAQMDFGDLKLGKFTIQAGLNAFVKGGNFPFVIISHGSGGDRLHYLTLAQKLAESGYVVAMPEHFGNNEYDNFLQGSTRNLQLRPHHISLCIDEVAQNGILDGTVQTDNVAVIGHSMGGYGALALAGGKVWNNLTKNVPVIPEKRLQALVLLAPATDWFMPEGSLAKIEIPVLAYLAEHDEFTSVENINKVLDQIPNQSNVKRHLIENASISAFTSPFPEAMIAADFTVSQDRDGFDRAEFNKQMVEQIIAFLDTQLKAKTRQSS